MWQGAIQFDEKELNLILLLSSEIVQSYIIQNKISKNDKKKKWYKVISANKEPEQKVNIKKVNRLYDQCSRLS